jgi:hypothetical protein
LSEKPFRRDGVIFGVFPELVAPPVELLARAGDLAAEALRVAATHGPLPPGVMPVEAREDGAILDPPASPRRRFTGHFAP